MELVPESVRSCLLVGKFIQAQFLAARSLQPVEICRIPATGYGNIRMTQTEQLILENAELKRENVELKKLLKESIESFRTKELADRIYSIDGIERPEPEPLPLNVDEEIPF